MVIKSKQPATARATITAIVASVVIMVTTLYLLWSVVVVPNNNQAFSNQVVANLADYRQRVAAFVVDLDNKVKQSIADSGVSEFSLYLSLDTESLTAALNANTISVEEISVFSAKKIDAYLGTDVSPESANAKDISFLTIDMFNRLQSNNKIYWEAARKTKTSPWHLNKIFPIKNKTDELIGAVRVTILLDGLQQVFSAEDSLAGSIRLSQSINRETPIYFFYRGNSESFGIAKTATVENSYWQVQYQPSVEFKASFNQIPQWLLGVGAGLLLVLMLATILVSRKAKHEAIKPVRKIDKNTEKTTDHKIKVEDTKASELVEKPSKTQAQEKPEKSKSKPKVAPEIFRAYDIRGIVGQQLSKETFYALGQAIASEALAAGEESLIVGRDSREHSIEFSEVFIDGVVSTGCHAIDIGLVPTPLVNFAAIHHAETSSGAIITASHNPANYNGCKIVIKGNTLVDEEIQNLKRRIDDDNVAQAAIRGAKTTESYAKAYIDRIVSDLAIVDGWRVVVDAANGAASELAIHLFEALQCELTPLFCEFDGKFPNHDPDPSVKSNLQALIDKVKETNADAGFAFDGDGDRLVVVTAQGDILWPDQLMMLFAQDIVARNPGCDVVYDIKSSTCLGELIVEYGGRPVMWKTGHSHIKAKMRETGALLGGEFSGHIFFKDRWFGFDDGLYAAARVLEIMTLTGQTLDNLFNSLPTRFATSEIKVPIAEEEKFAFIQELIDKSDFDSGEITTIDGVRVDYGDAWALVRASNTAPALTLRFEASNENKLDTIKSKFKKLLHNINKDLPLDF